MTPEERADFKHCLKVGAVFALILFTLAPLIWLNGPSYKEEKANQRMDAIRYVQIRQYDALPGELDDLIRRYKIQPEEINPVLGGGISGQ